MGVGRADGLGVSTGQPGRIDQHSTAYQDQLRPGVRLEIPKTGVDRNRNGKSDKTPSERAREGDAALSERGNLWQNGTLASWQGFANGRNKRGPETGAVVIDGQHASGVHAAAELPPPPRAEAPQDGWGRLNAAHQQAARFEEYAEGAVQPFIHGERPSPRARRRFTIDD
ncbi:hypothetical protein L6R52_27425 [Myxococcota bacterium]|nr:hypothetical protein [Myxococcota bacterium]